MSDTVYNKIVKRENGVETVLIDLDSTTLSTTDLLLSGVTAHNNAGVQITGTGSSISGYNEYSIGSYMDGSMTYYKVKSYFYLINYFAFYKCPNLTSLDLTDSASTTTYIGVGNFYDCPALTNLKFREGTVQFQTKTNISNTLGDTFTIKNPIGYLRLGTYHGRQYWAYYSVEGDSRVSIYRGPIDDRTLLVTLTPSVYSFTDEYSVTFTAEYNDELRVTFSSSNNEEEQQDQLNEELNTLYNKIYVGNQCVINLNDDSLYSESDLKFGITALSRSGSLLTGSALFGPDEYPYDESIVGWKNGYYKSCTTRYNCNDLPTDIRDYAFIYHPELSLFYNSGVLSSVTGTIGDYALSFCPALTSSSMDFSNVKHIGNYAFAYDTSLTSIDISNADTIGSGAFYRCEYLGTITVKNGVTITPLNNTYSTKIATINGYMYTQKGTDSNAIYRDGTLIGTLTSSNLRFTYGGVTFTRTASSSVFTITW